MRYCGKCGARVSDTAIFCTECGCKLSIVESTYGMNYNQTSRSQPFDTSRNESSSIILTAVIAGFITFAILATFVYFTAYRPAAQKRLRSTAAPENIRSVVVPKKDPNNQLETDIEPTVEPIEEFYIKTF